MKTKRIFSTGLVLSLFFFCMVIYGSETATTREATENETITLYSTSGLTPLANRLADGFASLYRGKEVLVAGIPESGITDALKNPNGIVLTNSSSLHGTSTSNSWTVTTGRNIIVPVISTSNPRLHEIEQTGISPAGIALMASGSKGMLYLEDDPVVKERVSGFLGMPFASMTGIITAGATEIPRLLADHPSAVAFCRINSILNENQDGLTNSLVFLPIDKNGNGKLDYMENYYSSLQEFTRSVWIGKYPHALCANICIATAGQPTDDKRIAFIKYVLTDGQSGLTAAGFTDLVYNERQTQLDKLAPVSLMLPESDNTTAVTEWIIVGVIGLLFLILLTDFLIRRYRTRRLHLAGLAEYSGQSFDETTIRVPGGLLFDKTHTWAFMEESGRVRVGIDDFLQHVTGPITRVEMKDQGERVKKGGLLATVIQEGKQLNVYAPVTGIIREKNLQLPTHSRWLNRAPFEEGWLYKIEPVNWTLESKMLQMADTYRSLLGKEMSRLKDFLSTTLAQDPSLSLVALQDGGALKDGVLEDLSPKIWEEFQLRFLDTAR